MAKRMHKVTAPKKGGNTITITIDGQQQAKMRKAASRQAQIDAGMYTRSGAGTHGGGQRSENRRERHKARQAVRSGQYD